MIEKKAIPSPGRMPHVRGGEDQIICEPGTSVLDNISRMNESPGQPSMAGGSACRFPLRPFGLRQRFLPRISCHAKHQWAEMSRRRHVQGADIQLARRSSNRLSVRRIKTPLPMVKCGGLGLSHPARHHRDALGRSARSAGKTSPIRMHQAGDDRRPSPGDDRCRPIRTSRNRRCWIRVERGIHVVGEQLVCTIGLFLRDINDLDNGITNSRIRGRRFSPAPSSTERDSSSRGQSGRESRKSIGDLIENGARSDASERVPSTSSTVCE